MMMDACCFLIVALHSIELPLYTLLDPLIVNYKPWTHAAFEGQNMVDEASLASDTCLLSPLPVPITEDLILRSPPSHMSTQMLSSLVLLL